MLPKIFSRIKLSYLFTNPYLSLARLILIYLLQPRIKLHQCCFNVVSTSDTDFVSTLCNVENPISDFVSFSTSYQRYFNVDPQRWNNVHPTLKCWLGTALIQENTGRDSEKLYSCIFYAVLKEVICFGKIRSYYLISRSKTDEVNVMMVKD